MKHLTEMKPGETMHLRSGRDLELESVIPASRLAKIANDKAPFIWWIYDAARVVKRGGGTLFYPLGRSAGIHRRTASRWPDGQVGHCVGQKGTRHGRLERLFCPAI